MKISKKRKEIISKIDLKKEYSVSEAVSALKGSAKAKFNESVDISMSWVSILSSRPACQRNPNASAWHGKICQSTGNCKA
jgi:ribosomal protein L1